jgi:MFS family permease
MDVGQEAGVGQVGERATAASGMVLLTLASAQFLMTLDSSVMNVSIATVAKDVGTTVTGIQTAITFYTLVMASLMITGGKLGQILGRKRAFAIGCVIYGCGSLITALSPNLAVLMLGWSVLEGVGAALIMPAIVVLVASNFARAQPCVRAGRLGWRDRGRSRPADRRPVHHLRVLAVGVRRGGPGGAGHLGAHPPHRRYAGGPGYAA